MNQRGMSGLTSKMSPSTSIPEPNINLSREELLKLLSVFEGELQARDEVIEILKSERPNNPAVKERYGLSNKPIQALQRDAATLDVTNIDHIAEHTQENLHKIIQHQKESHKKLKKTLIVAEQTNQKISAELEEEKRKHQDYMIKSDDFVNLLEQERERLKIALEQEKAVNERKDKETSKKLKINKEELSKLKSLSLVLVEERQHHVTELSEHKQQIADLERRLQETENKYTYSEKEINSEREHATQLENDLERQCNKYSQGQEELRVMLTEEKQKNQQLEEKALYTEKECNMYLQIKTLTHQLKKLRSVEKNLRKTDDQLWRIHEKLEHDEEHELLLEEVELLRQRVKDMEEAERIYTQAQEDCKDIRIKLEEEIALTRSLRSELKTLQTQVKNQKELQRCIEDTDFRFDELQLKFDFEKKKSSDMKEQLQKMKGKMSELNEFETILKESEAKINSMKEEINMLNDERKCSEEQIKFLIDKNLQLKSEAKEEREKVNGSTEKLIQESRKVLRLKEELNEGKRQLTSQVHNLKDELDKEKEKNEEILSAKQTKAEEANDRLRRQVIMLKGRLDQLEVENEQKDKELTLAQKYPKEGMGSSNRNSADFLSMVKKVQETEERCKQLSEQLHMKTKLYEETKKELTQSKHLNNNCNKTSVAAVTQTDNIERDAAVARRQTEGKLQTGVTEAVYRSTASVKKIQNTKSVTASRTSSSNDSAIPNTIKSIHSPAVTKTNNKPPISPSPSKKPEQSRNTKPVTVRIGKKSNGTSTNSPIEMTFTQNIGCDAKSSSTGKTTIKIVRGDKNSNPAIEVTGTPAVASSSQKTLAKKTDSEKRLDVSDKNTKISKQHTDTKPIRTFHYQKDFSELQKKWNSKIKQ